MQQLLQQAQQMQQQLVAAQQELAESEVTGQAGNGLVTVTLTGEGAIKALKIDPSVVDPSDVETLEDLVIGALDDAHRALSELATEKMGPLAGGLSGGLGLPGF
ncbi:MAG TPA: YbaB/EbfC family nucleoid-associated protein [Pseudonocardiaceae bacterium]|nr:YbaB/EbfC family nucleoid-associated protein [Pseudonocardiaceae bacterium]